MFQHHPGMSSDCSVPAIFPQNSSILALEALFFSFSCENEKKIDLKKKSSNLTEIKEKKHFPNWGC